MFQSSPAPRRGRYTLYSSPLIEDEMFQSSPAPRRGRYIAAIPVSPPMICFNPRPRLGAGATIVSYIKGQADSVSILARASARALQTPRR